MSVNAERPALPCRQCAITRKQGHVSAIMQFVPLKGLACGKYWSRTEPVDRFRLRLHQKTPQFIENRYILKVKRINVSEYSIKRFSELQSGRPCIIFYSIKSFFLAAGSCHTNKHGINPDSIETAMTCMYAINPLIYFCSGQPGALNLRMYAEHHKNMRTHSAEIGKTIHSN